MHCRLPRYCVMFPASYNLSLATRYAELHLLWDEEEQVYLYISTDCIQFGLFHKQERHFIIIFPMLPFLHKVLWSTETERRLLTIGSNMLVI